jgi:hypothetical protein
MCIISGNEQQLKIRSNKMTKYTLTVHEHNGTEHNHHVHTIKFARKLQREFMKQNYVLCAAIYKKVEEGVKK